MTLIAPRHGKPEERIARHATPRDLWEQLFNGPTATLFASRAPRSIDGNGADVGLPPMNFAEDATGYEVSVELPGVKEEEIHVDLLGRQLIVSAERRWTDELDAQQFHHVESRYGAMSRSVTLPDDARAEPDAIEARCDMGVLHVHVPKVEPTPSRRIAVKRG